MSWEIRIPRSVQRELDELPDTVWREGMEAGAELRDDPFPVGSKILEGYTQRYRMRFYRGQYRIVYDVSHKQRRVILVRVRHRRDVYRGL
ncbi:MAG: type II toxin-antitoxin system RelE/ParE family toxin [Acidobacteriota bacterium]